MKPMKKELRSISESARDVPVYRETDVVVCGGGPAGFVAAVAAARNGARTLLIERYGFLGGMASAGLVRGISGVRFEKEAIVGGIPWELVLRMEKIGGAASDAGGPGVPYDFPVDAEVLKYMAAEMVLEAGADLLLHTLIVDVFRQADSAAKNGSGRIRGRNSGDIPIGGVIIENKSGRQAVAAKVLIDCTGDGDVAAHAGLAYEKGRREDGAMQNMTLVFILGGLDTDRLWKLWEKDFDRLGTANQRLRRAAKEAHAKGEIPTFGGPWVRGSVKGVRPGEMYVNMVRRWGDATDADELTKAEIEGRRDAMAFYDWLRKKIPELKDARLIQTGIQIGLRETRRILGDYVLSREDIQKNRSFPDSIARGAHPIDIHPPSNAEDQTLTHIDKAYGIPYRCLLPRDAANFLVAGRCLSATHEAQATARVMGTCMAMGEAAGTAAALAVKAGVQPREVDIAALQGALKKQGAVF
ncbi:MAG TPA: FAD-dependent oxidoreductase [Spirochaetia bacterium]|nr:FAD-dependent oxidoreductase [Spirochaetia bacterium]